MSRKRTLTVGLTAFCLSGALLLPQGAHALMPHASQNISLLPGWNAVYVQVAPEQTADALFADWPVDHVGLYDPASFLATRQFSAEWNSQGLSREAMAVWYRGVPEASSLNRVPAGSVLVAFNATQTTFLKTLTGAPAAPRTTWHVSGTNTVYNFVGFSVSQQTDIDAYLEGSPCENVLSRAYYRIGGDDPNAAPDSIEVRSWASTVKDGDVLLLPSDKISDWSGVLKVSPLNGVGFGQTSSKAQLSIGNEGTASRTVSVELAQPVNGSDLFASATFPACLWARDVLTSLTNAPWAQAGTYGKTWSKTLAPGETWNLEFGVDRAALGAAPKGQTFGALLRVTENGASHAKAVVPIWGETSGAPATSWKEGLWIADVAFDSVSAPGAGKATKAGGTFKVRLPIHCDQEGAQRLLQRVVLAGTVAADGTCDYKLYAGSATPPATDQALMRISAVCLPTETPVIARSAGDLWEGAPEGATFAFTVAGDGATSLLRHPYHPQHDGLRWDFTTPAPSGDDVSNYQGDVKPETFSVDSAITLKIDNTAGVTDWNPEKEFSGTCTWTLSGLRHEGNVVVSGPMVIKRVSPVAQLVFE